MKRIFFNVSGKPTDTPIISTDDPRDYHGVFESANRCIFTLDDDANGGGHLFWQDKSVNFLLPPPGDHEAASLGLPPLVYVPVVAEPKHLRADGWNLTKSDNSRWIASLHSDFRLLQMWLGGDRLRVEHLLDQRAAAGSHGPRVFGTCAYLFQLDPRRYPNHFYYDELRAFANYLFTRGMYWELTVFTDQQMPPFDGFDRQEHWARTCQALMGSPNTIIELANENAKNGIDATNFLKVGDCLTSTGSYCDGWEPTGGWGDYVTFHPRRDWKWPFTVGVTSSELRHYPDQNKPILINEPIGADEFEQHGRRSSDVMNFHRMAVDCSVWAAGGVFHSQAGLQSEPWGPIQTACAEAYFAGLKR